MNFPSLEKSTKLSVLWYDVPVPSSRYLGKKLPIGDATVTIDFQLDRSYQWLNYQWQNSKLRIWIKPKKVEPVTCSIKTDPKIDFCETRKKRTLATVVDDDGFPRYNYQEGRTDTKESFKNHVKGDADIDEFWKMLIIFLSLWPSLPSVINTYLLNPSPRFIKAMFPSKLI